MTKSTTEAVTVPNLPRPSTGLDALPWFGGQDATMDQLSAPTEYPDAPTPPAPPPPAAAAPRPAKPPLSFPVTERFGSAPTEPPTTKSLGTATTQPLTAVHGELNHRMRDDGEIARGGMGSIRKVYDTELRRHVARKVIDTHLGDNPFAAQKFVDEARITGILEHPNVVPVHDLVVTPGVDASYTMKLVSGETLTKLIASQKTRRDLEHILQCMIKVCEALAYAHSRGVIHRDLKPDNIMVGEYGQVYVMDWGCALVIDRQTISDSATERDGTIMGTIQFMAPEQALGDIGDIDARSDVFSLGAILYCVLTGSSPYPGPTAVALPMAQLAEYQPPGEGMAVKPPPHLVQIVLKAMAKEKSDRFQSAEELAEALRQFLRGGNWFPMRKFEKGEVIVREGDPPDAAYIITSGRCEVRKRDAKKPDKFAVLRTLKAGDVFGETAIFADVPRSASVVALEDVTTVVVERTALEGVVESSWLGQFVKALADRFLDLDARLAAATKK